MAKTPQKEVLWQSQRLNALGLPWTFTRYSLDQDRLYINRGFLTSVEDEVRLYRITDITLRRSLWQKLFGMGTIHCDSSDATAQNFEIINVKHPKEVKDMLSELVDASRQRNRVYTSESMRGGQPPVPPPDIDRTDANDNGIPDVLEK
ncbi:MAG: PH domain-containing protein [bacterium]